MMGILLMNMAIVFIFAGTFIDELYTRSKTKELVRIQQDIKKAYVSDSEDLPERISSAEQKNVTLLIFTMSGKNADIEYFSRSTDGPQGMSDMMRGRYSPVSWINYAYNNGFIGKLEDAENTDILTLETDPLLRMHQGNEQRSINVFSILSEDIYLFLETPLEQIESAAALGVRFMLLISLFTLIIAAVVLAFLSKKITAPILEASQAANRIANLDFREKCKVRTNDELGELAGSINSMSDRLKENLERLTVMNAMLREDLEKEEASNRMRRDFIANVSHDFKTPITLIAAYGESIRDIAGNTKDPESVKEIREQCGIIISESRKMDDLVNQLLRLAMLESKTVVLQESLFDLDDMISGAIQSIGILMKDKGIAVDFEADSGRTVYADYPKTLQVMQNLLDNAVKHSPQGGRISVSAEEMLTDISETVYRVKIYNDFRIKPGVDPNMFFESFYKGDDSRSLQDKSYGLGLAIVKAIAELHGRQCGAYAQGDGLVFWFDILKRSDK